MQRRSKYKKDKSGIIIGEVSPVQKSKEVANTNAFAVLEDTADNHDNTNKEQMAQEETRTWIEKSFYTNKSPTKDIDNNTNVTEQPQEDSSKSGEEIYSSHTRTRMEDSLPEEIHSQSPNRKIHTESTASKLQQQEDKQKSQSRNQYSANSSKTTATSRGEQIILDAQDNMVKFQTPDLNQIEQGRKYNSHNKEVTSQENYSWWEVERQIEEQQEENNKANRENEETTTKKRTEQERENQELSKGQHEHGISTISKMIMERGSRDLDEHTLEHNFEATVRAGDISPKYLQKGGGKEKRKISRETSIPPGGGVHTRRQINKLNKP
ncbi:uncharacterized protein LOC129872669 [Solanum dulcamara]|uniref:uncharacterized protein LOC129872669 n=1 Tax=Solanum dulcamara TaxID=45834 RepID=UPI0024863B51|nr:uncharacterized protein LOC129872669 [Solanum dulcamara]